MFNILDFIDSKDIREYNRNTQFTPIEQAYLIYYSRKTTIDEKMTAWQELLSAYSEEDFELTRFGKVRFNEHRTNRQILADMVTVYENTLSLQNCTKGVVFEARHHRNPQEVYFPDYDSAFQYLEEQKQYTDEDHKDYIVRFGDWPNAAITAEIRVRTYGKSDWYSNVFHFDGNLRLIHLWPNRELFESEWGALRYPLIYIPTPFEKGDIVRLISSDIHEYGILEDVPDENYYAFQSKEMFPKSLHDVQIYRFKDDDAHGHFSSHYCRILELERCSEDELSEDQQILGFLSNVYKGQARLGDFLCSYSYHGKDARIF